MARYIRGGLGKTPKRGKKDAVPTTRYRRKVDLDEREGYSRRYEGDYQRGGGGDYGSRLADGFGMLGGDE